MNVINGALCMLSFLILILMILLLWLLFGKSMEKAYQKHEMKRMQGDPECWNCQFLHDKSCNTILPNPCKKWRRAKDNRHRKNKPEYYDHRTK